MPNLIGVWDPNLHDRLPFPWDLDRGVYPSEIFNRAAIEEIVNKHYSRNARHENLLSLPISVGLAAKFFLQDDSSGVPDNLL